MEQRIDHLDERAQATVGALTSIARSAPNCPLSVIGLDTGRSDRQRGSACGGGRRRLSGLTAALRLRGTGCRVTVVERGATPVAWSAPNNYRPVRAAIPVRRC